MSAPFHAPSMPVREEWLDYNGHVNDSAYAVMCAAANESYLEHLGISAAYQAATGCTTYTVEAHLRFLAEVVRGQVVDAEILLVDCDAKRLRLHTTLRVGDVDVLTGEYLFLHVDQRAGGVAPFPPDRAAVLERERAEHAALARPTHLGRGVGAPRT